MQNRGRNPESERRGESIRIVDGGEYWYCRLDLSIMKDPSVSTHETLVYAALCSFVAPGEADCFPSLSSIAARAKCSVRQVTRCLKTLEEKGYIEVHRRGDQRKSSIYYLTRKRTPARTKGSSGKPEAMDSGSTMDRETIDTQSYGQADQSLWTDSPATMDSQSTEIESGNIKTPTESHRRAREAHCNDGPPETPPEDLSPGERKILHRIKPVMGAKFDVPKDRDYLRRLMTDYPELDIGEVMEDWATWAEEKWGTLGKRQNPHSQWRNFCRNARKEGRHVLKGVYQGAPPGMPSSSRSVEELRASSKYPGFIS